MAPEVCHGKPFARQQGWLHSLLWPGWTVAFSRKNHVGLSPGGDGLCLQHLFLFCLPANLSLPLWKQYTCSGELSLLPLCGPDEPVNDHGPLPSRSTEGPGLAHRVSKAPWPVTHSDAHGIQEGHQSPETDKLCTVPFPLGPLMPPLLSALLSLSPNPPSMEEVRCHREHGGQPTVSHRAEAERLLVAPGPQLPPDAESLL